MFDYVFLVEQMLILLICIAFYFAIRYITLQHKKWVNPNFQPPSYSAKISRALLAAIITACIITFVFAQYITVSFAYFLTYLEQVIHTSDYTLYTLFLINGAGWLFIITVLLILIYYKLIPTERLAWLKSLFKILAVSFLILSLVQTALYFLALDTVFIPELYRGSETEFPLYEITSWQILSAFIILIAQTVSYYLLRKNRKGKYYSIYLMFNLLFFIVLIIHYHHLGNMLLGGNLLRITGFTHQNYFIIPIVMFVFFSAFGSVILSGVYMSVSSRLLVPSFGRAYALKYASVNYLSLVILVMVPIYPLLMRLLFD